MPYIAIKAYPKDETIKQKVVEEINAVFLKYWGCPPQAISVSMESVAPEDWDETVRKTEILPNADRMMILDGEKRY